MCVGASSAASERDERGFCGGVRHLAACAAQPPHGRDVHDTARVLTEHRRQDGLDGVERAVDVHAEIAPPHLLRHVLKKRLPRDARVVHKKAHRAERILHAAHHILYLRAVGNVRLKRSGTQSLGGKLRHERVGAVLPDVIVYGNGIALMGKTARRRAADAAARAGDKCDLFHFVSSL